MDLKTSQFMKKRFRQKLLLFVAHILALPILLLYRATLRIRISGQQRVRQLRREGKGLIYAFWHENMILGMFPHQNWKVYVLVSRHFDGEVITRILHAYGLRTVRGSSTRGGSEAYRWMRYQMKQRGISVAFTPDGPLGPRRRAKSGVVRLASETGRPIIPIGVAANRYKRLNSWDQLMIVLPFARCRVVYGAPFYVPPLKDAREVQIYQEKLNAVINELDRRAEAWLR